MLTEIVTNFGKEPYKSHKFKELSEIHELFISITFFSDFMSPKESHLDRMF